MKRKVPKQIPTTRRALAATHGAPYRESHHDPETVARRIEGPEGGQPDVEVTGGGTVYQLWPLTPAARAWIEENVAYEPYQKMGTSVVVEHRYVADIVLGMIDAGLAVR